MEALNEIRRLAERIFCGEARLKVIGGRLIQADYNPTTRTVRLTRGLVEAYRRGHITLRNVEAILWHEHGEKTYYKPRKLLAVLFLTLVAAVHIIFCIIHLVVVYHMIWFTLGLLVGICLTMACFCSPLNRAKELLCDVHATVNMGSVKEFIATLSRIDKLNRDVKINPLSRFRGLFMEKLCGEHPETQERVRFLERLKKVCENKGRASG